VITILQVPQMVESILTQITDSPIVMLLIINVILLMLGCFMEMLAVMLITVPVFLPVLTSVGVDPVHFGVLMTVNLMLGLLTPPFGINLFIIQKISNVPILKMIKDLVPFFGVILVVILLLVFFPSIVTFLPNLL